MELSKEELKTTLVYQKKIPGTHFIKALSL